MKKLLVITVLFIPCTPIFCMKPRARSLSAGALVGKPLKQSLSVITVQPPQQNIMLPPFSSQSSQNKQVYPSRPDDGVYEATCCLTGCMVAGTVLLAWLRQPLEPAA